MNESEFSQEREAQKANWSESSDDAMTIPDWAALLAHYSTRRVFGDLKSIDAKAFRADMVKVGALAKACIESLDRKAQNNV